MTFHLPCGISPVDGSRGMIFNLKLRGMSENSLTFLEKRKQFREIRNEIIKNFDTKWRPLDPVSANPNDHYEQECKFILLL